MADDDGSVVLPIFVAAVLVCLSGLFSGLNLGLMSFTDDDLGLVIEGSHDPAEVANAKAIKPVRAQGNLLLCTLLLGNTLVNAVIAVLLADLTSGLIGTCVTTGLIVVFGEIIPQSVCSRHALAIGAAALPLVRLFMLVCWPIAYPISLLLDHLLGREVPRSPLLACVASHAHTHMHTCISYTHVHIAHACAIPYGGAAQPSLLRARMHACTRATEREVSARPSRFMCAS